VRCVPIHLLVAIWVFVQTQIESYKCKQTTQSCCALFVFFFVFPRSLVTDSLSQPFPSRTGPFVYSHVVVPVGCYLFAPRCVLCFLCPRQIGDALFGLNHSLIAVD